MKFRVWNKKNKRFAKPTHEQGRVETLLLSPGGKLFIYKQNGNFTQLKEVKGYEIDRWIGLKDMYSREIYENDIVVWGHHCPNCRENPVRIAVVKINPDIEFFELRMGYFFKYGSFRYQDASHLEVVGNIRENPEVLENPDAFLSKVFRPLDRFMVFSKTEKGKVGGFLLYEGKNFVAYGYGNGKSAKPFYDKAISLSMEVFKRLLEIETNNIAQPNLIDASPIYKTQQGEQVGLWRVENIEDLPDDGTLMESVLDIQDMGRITYIKPYFRFPPDIEKGARRHGLARFFLSNLDKVWAVKEVCHV